MNTAGETPGRGSSGVLRFALAVLVLAVGACTSLEPRPQAAHAAPIDVMLIAFNDFHGQLTSPGGTTRVSDESSPSKELDLPTGGVAYLAGLVAQLKSQNPLNAVVAAGDLIGASPLSSAHFHDEPAIEALSAVGLEFSSVGNHEFDHGLAELRRMQTGGCLPSAPEDSCRGHAFTGARFKYLAANVIDTTTGKPIFPAFALKSFDAGHGRRLRIGFIGAVLKGVPNIVAPASTRNLQFLDEATAANAAVPALRAQGADVIVLLIHEGGVTAPAAFDDTTCPNFSGDLIPILDRLDPAIDLVVSAHTHRTYICRHNGRLVTSAGSQGRFVTDIELKIDPRSGHLIEASARQLAVVNDLAPNPASARYPTVAKNEQVQAIADLYTTAAASLTERTVGHISEDITRHQSPSGESALGDLLADAQLAATSAAADGGAQIAFMNLSGMRTDLLARDGRITYGQIQAVHPFGNSLVTLTLTGAQIRDVLEEQWDGGHMLQVSSGFTYEWHAEGAPGGRVDPASLRLNGAPIDPARKYRVAVNEFLAGGGDSFKVFANGTDRVRGVLDIEALEKYLATHSPVKVPAAGRIAKK